MGRFFASDLLSAPALFSLECGHSAFLWCVFLYRLWIGLCDTHIDFRRRFLPHLIGDVGVGVQRGGAGHMPQNGRQGLDVHSVSQSIGGEGVPLRYNYDKPEKPRISRVFGYLARFFILFQTEKSSREAVIS